MIIGFHNVAHQLQCGSFRLEQITNRENVWEELPQNRDLSPLNFTKLKVIIRSLMSGRKQTNSHLNYKAIGPYHQQH